MQVTGHRLTVLETDVFCLSTDKAFERGRKSVCHHSLALRLMWRDHFSWWEISSVTMRPFDHRWDCQRGCQIVPVMGVCCYLFFCDVAISLLGIETEIIKLISSVPLDGMTLCFNGGIYRWKALVLYYQLHKPFSFPSWRALLFVKHNLWGPNIFSKYVLAAKTGLLEIILKQEDLEYEKVTCVHCNHWI